MRSRPSEYDDILEFLVRVGVDRILVNPNALNLVIELVDQAESRVILDFSLDRAVRNKDRVYKSFITLYPSIKDSIRFQLLNYLL
ncbi:MAG: hypothetical protein QXJ93_00100 [Candidatus Rehaiarchaeum fermentans]|nr:hypothetical protein [Candidatus Rehaiarchaeum fermentans]MCW1311216.1 hypothetical protein [Candidatus Rehaiarchaeum fermentans]